MDDDTRYHLQRHLFGVSESDAPCGLLVCGVVGIVCGYVCGLRFGSAGRGIKCVSNPVSKAECAEWNVLLYGDDGAWKNDGRILVLLSRSEAVKRVFRPFLRYFLV